MLFIYFHVKSYSRWIPIHLSKSYQKHLVSSSHLKGRRSARSPSEFPAQRFLPGRGRGRRHRRGRARSRGPSGSAPPGQPRVLIPRHAEPRGSDQLKTKHSALAEAPKLRPSSRNRSQSSPTAADMSSV